MRNKIMALGASILLAGIAAMAFAKTNTVACTTNAAAANTCCEKSCPPEACCPVPDCPLCSGCCQQ